LTRGATLPILLPMSQPPTPPLYTLENYCREESVGYLLNAVKGRLSAALDAALAPYGVTATQWGTLFCIINESAPTGAELCRHLSCDTGSMTRMLDRLEEKGLVRRERSGTDRRALSLRPTPAGQALVQELLPAVITVLNRQLTGITAAELEQLKGLLRRILANG